MPDTTEAPAEPPKPVSMAPDVDVSPEVKRFVANAEFLWKWAAGILISLAAFAPAAVELLPQLNSVLDQHQQHWLFSLLTIAASFATHRTLKGN